MSAVKAFFLSRLLREKLLLVAFVGLGAAMWLSSFSARAGRLWRTHHAVSVDLAEQRQWLANRAAIEANASQSVKAFDPAQTLDDTRLVEQLSELGRKHNLKFTNETPQTERSNQFAVHTVQLNIPRAQWESLRDFYVALSARSPYLGIEQFTLAADRSNPSLLNASIRVSSVEIVQ